jgi:general stress protein YciG
MSEMGRRGGKKGGKARAENLSQEELSAIGRKGGKKGGRARAAALSPERRREIAQKAAAARHAKKASSEEKTN